MHTVGLTVCFTVKLHKCTVVVRRPKNKLKRTGDRASLKVRCQCVERVHQLAVNQMIVGLKLYNVCCN